jgi:hypothetical protein
VIHPACGQPAVETGDGLATVPLAVAVVQVGLYPPSEPQLRRPVESLIAADAALHDELITREQLDQAVERHVGHPGIHRVRHLVAQADGRHESVGETRLALVMRELGFRFTPQVWVAAGGRSWRTDFMLDDDPVAIEFDGLTKYGAGLESPTPAQLRSALASEKWREDRLRDAGNQVVRFVWTELDDRRLISRRIDEAVARARRGRSA